ncbi:hypothetical protein GCM10020229_69980 [Kitasatospora albolonga]
MGVPRGPGGHRHRLAAPAGGRGAGWIGVSEFEFETGMLGHGLVRAEFPDLAPGAYRVELGPETEKDLGRMYGHIRDERDAPQPLGLVAGPPPAHRAGRGPLTGAGSAQGVTGTLVSPETALVTVLEAYTRFGFAVQAETEVILIA